MAFHFSAMQVSEGERKRWHLLPNANLTVLWMLFGVCLSALPTAVNRQRPNCSNVSVVSISVIERGRGKSYQIWQAQLLDSTLIYSD